MFQVLLWVIYTACCISIFVEAAEEAAAEDTAAINFEQDDELANNEDDPNRIKRQHGHGGHPLGGLLSSVFNKKLGLIGSLSSISSSSKGGGVEHHHHSYDYAVSALYTHT